jgi:hypothetical protein
MLKFNRANQTSPKLGCIIKEVLIGPSNAREETAPIPVTKYQIDKCATVKKK